MQGEDRELPFAEHLIELRRRVMFAGAFLLLGSIGAWFFHEELFSWLMDPYRVAMAERFPDQQAYIQFQSLIEPIVVYLKTSLLVGLLVTAPLIIHQAWLFVAPGLYDDERRLALPFLVSTFLFFYGGVAFCRYLVLEPAITVLLGFGAVDTSPVIMMQSYFSFTSRILVVFGLVFELPVAIAFMARLGLVSSATLLRNWKYAAVGMVVVGAMLTPPDPLTQVVLAVPLLLLYFLSIGVAWLFERNRERLEAALPEGAAAPGSERRNRATRGAGDEP